MKKIWQWFCQKMADIYFYDWFMRMNRDGNIESTMKKIDNYHKWIERKFIFGK